MRFRNEVIKRMSEAFRINNVTAREALEALASVHDGERGSFYSTAAARVGDVEDNLLDALQSRQTMPAEEYDPLT